MEGITFPYDDSATSDFYLGLCDRKKNLKSSRFSVLRRPSSRKLNESTDWVTRIKRLMGDEAEEILGKF